MFGTGNATMADLMRSTTCLAHQLHWGLQPSEEAELVGSLANKHCVASHNPAWRAKGTWQ